MRFGFRLTPIVLTLTDFVGEGVLGSSSRILEILYKILYIVLFSVWVELDKRGTLPLMVGFPFYCFVSGGV